LANKLAEVEAVQVDIYRRKTVEAATAANVALDPGPNPVQALGVMLEKVKGEDLPSGVTKDQLATALEIFAKLVGSAGPAPAATGTMERRAAPAEAPVPAAEDGEHDPIEDFDMEDADLLDSVPAEDRAAFKLVKTRLQERGLGTSCSGNSGRRKELKQKQGLVRKEETKK
jgi:hypothetical protein